MRQVKHLYNFVCTTNYALARLAELTTLFVGRLKTLDLTSRDWTTLHHIAMDIARLVSVFE